MSAISVDVGQSHDMRRALLFAQFLSPPLPLVCVGADGSERVSSSHALLHTVMGRLLAVPRHRRRLSMQGLPEPVGGVHGGDWQAGLLGGPHALELLRACRQQARLHEAASVSELCGVDLDALVEEMYTHFCAYTRDALSLAMRHDTVGGGGSCGPQDLRFLQDPGRVSWSRDAALCRSAIDFHCSMMIYRANATDEDVEAARSAMEGKKKGAAEGGMMDYRQVIGRTMLLLCGLSEGMLRDEELAAQELLSE